MTTTPESDTTPVLGEPRAEILDAVRRFVGDRAAPFVPGTTYIPASGKQACPPTCPP